jgi:2-C-methyl-D-erythritol 4-phosphate cytidylyltransferase
VKIIAIIPAGGRGKRSGFAAPKQYLKFRGKELIVYTLEVFQNNEIIN